MKYIVTFLALTLSLGCSYSPSENVGVGPTSTLSMPTSPQHVEWTNPGCNPYVEHCITFDINGIYDINANPKEGWGAWIEETREDSFCDPHHPTRVCTHVTIWQRGPNVAYKKAAGAGTDVFVHVVVTSETPAFTAATCQASPTCRVL